MEKQKLPSKKELEKLYYEKGKDALVWYAWRSALRALPLLGDVSLETLWGKDAIKHGFTLVRINVLLSKGGGLPTAVVDAATVAADITNPTVATYAAIATTAAAAYADANAYVTAIDADYSTAAIITAYNAYAAYEAAAYAAAAYADFQLLNSADYKIDKWPSAPLWQVDKPPFIGELEQSSLKELYVLQLGFLADDVETLWAGKSIEPNRLGNYAEEMDESILNAPLALEEVIVGDAKTQSESEADQKKGDKIDKVSSLLRWNQLSINHENISAEDFLGRDRLVNALVKLLTHPEQKAPLTVGLLGDWGAGKSTTIELLKKRLDTNKFVDYKVRIFNAWSYEHTDNIQAGVAQEAVEVLTDYGLKEDTTDSSGWFCQKAKGVCEGLKRGWVRLKLAWLLNHKLNAFRLYTSLVFLTVWFGIILYLTFAGRLQTVLDIGISTTLSILFFIHAMKPLLAHPFAKEFHTYLNLPDYSKSIGQLPVFQKHVSTLAKLNLNDDKRLLFVVDDLDRCSPGGIVKVFEAVRLMMELPRVVVIIAIDHHIALAALAHHYQELVFDGDDLNKQTANKFCNKYDIARDYLGKIIQLPINLDKPGETAVNSYIDHLFDGVLLDVSSNEEKSDLQQFHAVKTFGFSPASDVEKRGADLEKEPDVNNQIGGNSSAGVSVEEKEFDIVNEDKDEVLEMNTTMLHSHAEQTHFQLLTRLFGFHNPRQLKRLHSSYRLLRAYRDEDESKNQENMSLLFWLEFKYSHDQSESKKKREELKSHGLFKELLANDQKYKRLEKLVDSFVLPRA